MSRKDVIIITVLLNAALLIALFATSVQSDKAPLPIVQTVASNYGPVKDGFLPPLQPSKEAATLHHEDSIDQVVKQYVTPQIKNGGQNFLADLDVIGSVEPKEPTTISTQKTSPRILYKKIKMQPGDSLEKISKQYQVSVADLIELNQLASSQIQIGQVLKIPSKNIEESPTETSQFYTIKPGDSPWSIAVKHQMKVSDLLKLNNMDDTQARRLKPGQQIRLK